MTARYQPTALAARDEIVSPPAARSCEDRTFEFPPAIHITMALLFLGFVSVLSFAFRSPGLAVPFAIFVLFIAAFFTVPALWAGMKPDENASRSLGWSELGRKGIQTPDGRVSGSEATVLVLMLPFMIFCWAIAVAIIAALQ